MKVNKFRAFGNKEFGLNKFEERLQDQRKRPIIGTKEIVHASIEMPIRGQKSLLEVDQERRFLPKDEVISTPRRNLTLSDTTIINSLSGIPREEVRHYIYRHILRLTKGKNLTFQTCEGRKLVVGVVDGSVFGNIEGSVLGMIGTPDWAILIDFERSEGRGHELSASDRLLSRSTKKLGKGFFDLIITDGLYFSENVIRRVREDLGSEILIKTSEENLELIQDAWGLFFGRDYTKDTRWKIESEIEYVEGVDEKRGVLYKVYAASGFEWRGHCFKVAYVWEKKLKPKKDEPEVEEFWVIVTMGPLTASLTGKEMRELAHGRWLIENKGFKQLNERVGSKRRYIKNKDVKESLLLLWFIGLMILTVYLVLGRMEGILERFKGVKITLRFFSRCILGNYENTP